MCFEKRLSSPRGGYRVGSQIARLFADPLQTGAASFGLAAEARPSRLSHRIRRKPMIVWEQLEASSSLL